VYIAKQQGLLKAKFNTTKGEMVDSVAQEPGVYLDFMWLGSGWLAKPWGLC
jgi:hypothetical protein